MNVVLYSTGCPKCGLLKSKLNEKDIEYDEITDVDTMIGMGIKAVPMMMVDGELMDFNKAIKFLQECE